MLNQEQLWEAFQIFQSMLQPNPNPQLAPPAPSQQTSAAVEVVHNSKEVEDLRKQIANLEDQLAAAKLEIQSLTEQRENIRHEVQEREGELSNLRVEMSKIEVFHGQSWAEMLDEIESTSGEEYYEMHRKEWYEKKLTKQEMQEQVEAFTRMKKKNNTKDLIDFEDEPRMSPHTTQEKIERGKEEIKRGNTTGYMEEIRDNGFDKGPKRSF